MVAIDSRACLLFLFFYQLLYFVKLWDCAANSESLLMFFMIKQIASSYVFNLGYNDIILNKNKMLRLFYWVMESGSDDEFFDAEDEFTEKR